jgi:hypothetical protein
MGVVTAPVANGEWVPRTHLFQELQSWIDFYVSQ